jgi:hypothetical protein
MPIPLLHSVRCNNCGAPLQIPEAARFVTCQHCKADLQVEQNADVVYTKVIEKLAQHIVETQSQLERIEAQQSLDRLDREWESKRREILGADAPSDAHHCPSYWGLWGFGPLEILLLVAFGWIALTGSGERAFPMFFGALLLGFWFVVYLSRYRRYRQELTDYLWRRSQLTQGMSTDRR